MEKKKKKYSGYLCADIRISKELVALMFMLFVAGHVEITPPAIVELPPSYVAGC